MQLSIVDTSIVAPQETQADALRNTIDLAQRLDDLGYARYWLAEHHGTGSLASHAPEVLIPVVAAATRHIRIGSGAVLLNHYSPYKVAEQFRILHALFPDRIDLGIGRAHAGPVADVALARLRNTSPADDYPQQLVELIAWIAQEMPADHPFAQVPILPEVAGYPQPWLLGSSLSSPRLAAELGLPYAFAGFIAPQRAQAALQTYQAEFQPSASAAGVQAPRAMLGVHVVCADTQERAEYLAMTVRGMYARLAKGIIGHRLPTPEEAIEEMGGCIPAEDEPWPRFVVGTPERVLRTLTRMAQLCGIDEIIIQDMILSYPERVRSYELLAEAFALRPPSS